VIHLFKHLAETTKLIAVNYVLMKYLDLLNITLYRFVIVDGRTMLIFCKLIELTLFEVVTSKQITNALIITDQSFKG